MCHSWLSQSGFFLRQRLSLDIVQGNTAAIIKALELGSFQINRKFENIVLVTEKNIAKIKTRRGSFKSANIKHSRVYLALITLGKAWIYISPCSFSSTVILKKCHNSANDGELSEWVNIWTYLSPMNSCQEELVINCSYLPNPSSTSSKWHMVKF